MDIDPNDIKDQGLRQMFKDANEIPDRMVWFRDWINKKASHCFLPFNHYNGCLYCNICRIDFYMKYSEL